MLIAASCTNLHRLGEGICALRCPCLYERSWVPCDAQRNSTDYPYPPSECIEIWTTSIKILFANQYDRVSWRTWPEEALELQSLATSARSNTNILASVGLAAAEQSNGGCRPPVG